MARRVFFSFHYDDVTRVNVVRNSAQIVRQYSGFSVQDLAAQIGSSRRP